MKNQRPSILGPDGQPIQNQVRSLQVRRRESLRAKYDAAQTTINNQNHWANSDNLDPHSANSLEVRRKLRARSRYEIMENNPYLKGTLLTIANDFTGSGPKLQVTDRRISTERRRLIERRWMAWSHVVKLRRMVWRARMAKVTDGETFFRAYTNLRQRDPVKLSFQILETDMVSSEDMTSGLRKSEDGFLEVDGVKFDNFENPVAYHVLNYHPGGSVFFRWAPQMIGGNWVPQDLMIHWFRQDRGWLRGVPEITPSLPLCAILRRYTMAVLRQKEFAADFTGILETEGPPDPRVWTDGQGNLLEDDPFDIFPVEMGMFTTMPWGYRMKQLEGVPDGVQFDEFVGSMLREITRPLLAPYNIASGSSKDSNMASGVLDAAIYKGGQHGERLDMESEVLDRMFHLWWSEGIRVPEYFDQSTLAEADFLQANPSLREDPPEHRWRWDPIGIEHTDPAKVAQALAIAWDKGFITDRDIQETRYNRDVEDWREDMRDQMAFRQEMGSSPSQDTPEDDQEDPEDLEDNQDEEDTQDDSVDAWSPGEEIEAAEGIDFSVSSAMKEEARRGLAWRKEFNRGGTNVGARRATQIINDGRLSADTWRRVKAYFDRHQSDKSGEGWSSGPGYPSAGRIAWALWGGDPGWSRARKIVRQLESREESRK